MDDHVRVGHELPHEPLVEDRALDELGLPGVDQVADVVEAAGRQVVDEHDVGRPSRASLSARCEPMKPAPPVIRYLIGPLSASRPRVSPAYSTDANAGYLTVGLDLSPSRC